MSVAEQIEAARFLAAGQDDPHSVVITELCDRIEAMRSEALRERLPKEAPAHAVCVSFIVTDRKYVHHDAYYKAARERDFLAKTEGKHFRVMKCLNISGEKSPIYIAAPEMYAALAACVDIPEDHIAQIRELADDEEMTMSIPARVYVQMIDAFQKAQGKIQRAPRTLAGSETSLETTHSISENTEGK